MDHLSFELRRRKKQEARQRWDILSRRQVKIGYKMAAKFLQKYRNPRIPGGPFLAQ